MESKKENNQVSIDTEKLAQLISGSELQDLTEKLLDFANVSSLKTVLRQFVIYHPQQQYALDDNQKEDILVLQQFLDELDFKQQQLN